MGSSKKHKKHKSERRSKYDERPPSLKLILKVSGTPEYGSADSPYNIQQPADSESYFMSAEKHKKSKKKKKKKDREKRHKHHKEKKHRSTSSQEDLTMDDEEEDSSQLTTENALYYSSMSTSSNISSVPVTKAMNPLQPSELKNFYALQNVSEHTSNTSMSPEGLLRHLDSPNTPSSMESGTREPRSCVLKLKQSRSTLSKLLDHLLLSLEKRDPHQFFAFPVTDDIAPEYSSIISKPMDFSTIRQKIEDNEYTSLTEFSDDFKLMCDNAIKYNHPQTVFNKGAKKLLHAGMRLLQADNLMRTTSNPIAIYMKELTTKELGFDPMIKSLEDSEIYSIDSADEATTPNVNDEISTAQMEEDEQRRKLKLENEPKSKFDPFVDNLTADEILEQVQNSAKIARNKLLTKRKAHKMGFLRTNSDGTTSLQIIVPSNNNTPERMPTIADFAGKLQQGTTQIMTPREDTRNNAKLFKQLEYGSFQSFAPVYDSRFSNLSKDEMDLILNTYGDENGYQYADSITKFSKDSIYGSTLANRLLDLLTCGEHSKTIEILMENQQQKKCQKEVETLLPDYQQDLKRFENVQIDFEQLKTLEEFGVDTRFIDAFKKDPHGNKIQEQLNNNVQLIEQLHQIQHERLSAPLPQHLTMVQQPNKQENQLADKITTNLTDVAKKMPPSALVSVHGLRKAMGISIPQQSINEFDKFRHESSTNNFTQKNKENVQGTVAEVDTTVMDMDLETEIHSATTSTVIRPRKVNNNGPPTIQQSSTSSSVDIDNELRELLGGVNDNSIEQMLLHKEYN